MLPEDIKFCQKAQLYEPDKAAIQQACMHKNNLITVNNEIKEMPKWKHLHGEQCPDWPKRSSLYDLLDSQVTVWWDA